MDKLGAETVSGSLLMLHLPQEHCTVSSQEPDAMDAAYLESQLQQLCVHAMLLSQANAMVGPLRLAKVVHSLCHLHRHHFAHIWC
jgi:hypothetical protein